MEFNNGPRSPIGDSMQIPLRVGWGFAEVLVVVRGCGGSVTTAICNLETGGVPQRGSQQARGDGAKVNKRLMKVGVVGAAVHPLHLYPPSYDTATPHR